MRIAYGENHIVNHYFCACGKTNGVEHCLSCWKGGDVMRQHDDMRDVTASLLKEVSHNVETELSLEPSTTTHRRNAISESRFGPICRIFICVKYSFCSKMV